MTLPDYMPTVTFNPQCADCTNEQCDRYMLKLFRRNYIKCHNRVSDAKFWEPNGYFLRIIEEEFDKYSDAYTAEELEEARTVYESFKTKIA